MEVHLVADTNLFFECKNLEELPWTELGYDPVVILLTKPVLDEIDKHKKGTGRTRKRAIEIWQRVRAMLASSAVDVEIQAKSPKVVLRRTPPSVAPASAHKDHLDYAKTDERLVGIASTLSAQAMGYHVKLFTDDTGPASTADGLGVPYLMINDTWRRPASETSEEKELKTLEIELAAYRSQEPRITIGRCEPADESNAIEVVRKIAIPLTETEVEEFLTKLRLKHPPVMDFMPPPSSTRTDVSGNTTTIIYLAPEESDITKYRDTLYPEWLDLCRKLLTTLHHGRDEFESDIVLRWAMVNDGSRPASQVRVEFETQGHLALWRRSQSDENDGADDAGGDASTPTTANPRPRFPAVPRPPAYVMKVERVPAPVAQTPARGPDLTKLRAGVVSVSQSQALAAAAKAFCPTPSLDQSWRGLSAAAEAARLMQTPSILDSFRGSSSFDRVVPGSHTPNLSSYLSQLRLPPTPSPPDPEGFYYRDWPTMRPVTKGALTCDLWRHQSRDELFEFEVRFTKNGQARGIVQCTVHAGNLTKPEQAKVIVKRSVEPLSMIDLAISMVDDCK